MTATPRRVFGVETEFGITAARTDGAGPTQVPLEPVRLGEPNASEQRDGDEATGYGAAAFDAEEAARLLFAPVLERTRTTNRYLPNGARLYLDVGAHPEYASAECSDPLELLLNDRAGEEIYRDLVTEVNARLERDGRAARIHLLKNNVDSAGNSFGCHENYLVHRRREFRAMLEAMMSFLVTRQILTGAGHVRRAPDGTVNWAFSVRSDLVWDEISSATTRSRPIVNTRDEPHADAEKYRRLHVIAGDSNIAQATNVLKVAMTCLVLDLLEDGVGLSHLRVEKNTTAVRQISHDLTATREVEMADGGRMNALQIQEALLQRVLDHLDRQGTRGELSPGLQAGLDLWERGLVALRRGDTDAVAGELDWVAKKSLVDRYQDRTGAALDDPRVTRLLLAYHDVTSAKPLARSMEQRGLLRTLVDEQQITRAKDVAPQTTRAKLRGAVLAAGAEAHREVAADWLRLRVEDAPVQTLLLADPFATEDERVDQLLEHLRSEAAADSQGPVI